MASALSRAKRPAAASLAGAASATLPTYVTRDQARAIIRNTGIRVSELTNLRRSDLETSERKGRLIVWGKGEKQRVIPLNATVRTALRAYLDVRPERTDDHLFLGQRGPLTAKGVEILVRKYAYLAGLTNVTPHTLRHSFPKQTLDAGESLVTVKELLGHARLETTAIYTHSGPQDLERAVARLDEAE